MPWIEGGKFWVGRHNSRGIVVIPESSMLPNSMSFEVYFVDQDRVVDCNTDIMRQHTTSKNITSEEAQKALEAFLTLRDRELQEKNRRFLELRGKTFAGTRSRPESLPLRVTHCYACKYGLDSTINLECVSCNWIICQCGACGCCYDRTHVP